MESNDRQDVYVSQEPAKPAGPEEQLVLEGIGVAPGIAIGPAYLYTRTPHAVEERRLADHEVSREVERFQEAIARSEHDLRKIIAVTREKLGAESAGIFEAQRLMLRDEALYDAVLQYIRQKQLNADYAVEEVMRHHRQRIEASENTYIQERANDLVDVQDRIIRHLRRGKLLSSIDPETIVVAESLTAADLVLFSRRSIRGCVMDHGGATSHVSIVARALSLPTVVSMHEVTEALRSGDLVVVDGLQGRVIVRPTPEQLDLYRDRQARYEALREEQKHLVPLPSETRDGRRIALRANVEFSEEIALLDEYGAEGIGLFRTEQLLLMQGEMSLSEQFNFETYKKVVEAVRPAVTTIRLLDLGGDKMMPLAHREHNPFLGWRGIRVLFDKPEMLRAQVRAILRASAHGPVRILLPMVTRLQEVRHFKNILAETKESLAAEGLAFDNTVPVGIMVEVPAVALTAEAFAREVDFFSLGTNDLTQYVMAVDRGNDLVADRYSEFHPGVLALIERTVEAGHAHGLSVGLCGEMAAHPHAAPLLVGLGLDELSASPTYLPAIKRVIRGISYNEARGLVEEALSADDADDVEALVAAWMDERAGDITPLLRSADS